MDTDNRKSILGFLLGSTLAGSALYYYVVDEYRLSNQMLTEDIYVSLSIGLKWPLPSRRLHADAHLPKTLSLAVQRIDSYVRSLEEKIEDRK